MGTKWFSQILCVGGGSILKTIYLLHNDNIVSMGLQRTIRKIGNIVTLYHRELLKKIPSRYILYLVSNTGVKEHYAAGVGQ